MGKFIDLTGQRFGRLTVIKKNGKNKRGDILWLCKCDCGNTKNVSTNHLKNKNSKSCGCLFKEKARERALRTKRFYKHGLYKNKDYIRIMHIYCGMKERCYNFKSPRYKYYGARNIKMCNEWVDKENGLMSFYNWAINNGYKDSLTLDRINNDGNYEPNNCRWTTMKEQSNNKRNNRYITYNGKTHTLMEWCRIFDIDYKLTHQRIVILGWEVDKAFFYSKKKIRKVVQLDKNYKIIKIWDNIAKIQKEKGYNGSSIGMCCNNKRKTAYGFIWKFEDDEFWGKEE